MLNVDRGLSWEEAVAYRDANIKELEEAEEPRDPRVGFYVDRYIKDHGKTGVCACSAWVCHGSYSCLLLA